MDKNATRVSAWAFLKALIDALSRGINTVPTGDAIQCRFADGQTAGSMTDMFAMRRQENGIEHRFTYINHPCTNGQVERTNSTMRC